MIIALTGLAGSGKDTAAEMIAKHLGDATIIALADTPKEMAAEHFGLPIEYFYNRDLKDAPLLEGKSPREMMVNWFDKLFAKYGENYTLQMNIRKISEMKEKYVIVSDIRYPSEFKWVESEGIPLINIHREGVDETIDHKTEQATDLGVVVRNDGTIEDLRGKIVNILDLMI